MGALLMKQILAISYVFSAKGAGSRKSATGRIRRGEPGATPQGVLHGKH
jgi:hypothetical protein